jgi:N-acetylglucosaminyldiphosphoundecaprenol N-acetyl-beta-D-mannosaminyltransferase
MKPDPSRPAAHVLGIAVDALDMRRCLDRIDTLLHSSRNGYVCVAGVHGVMEAQRDPKLFRAYDCSTMTVPDGMPLVWTGWLQSHRRMARVAGPDLMLQVFQDPRFRNLRHFLYGGRKGVAEELKASLLARLPTAQIVGTYTPPFRELNEVELQQLTTQLSEAKVDVLWIGISCPRQELFMARHVDNLPARLMFGVGAAFDYHTGRIRDCAPWIKKAGLQWLHRLLQDPRRLWKRYARNNPAFLFRITAQLLRNALRGEPRHAPPAERHHGIAATRHLQSAGARMTTNTSTKL